MFICPTINLIKDSPSMGRNRNFLSLGNVAGEQTLVRTGISLTSLGDDRSEIPSENDFSSTAARFGDFSVMPVASAKKKEKTRT